MAGRDTAFPQRLRPHPRGVRGKAQGADRGDERGTQKSQGAACGHRPAGKADQETAQAVGLYASPPGGHGVLDHRQTNRPGAEYCEEALWGGSGNAGENNDTLNKSADGYKSVVNKYYINMNKVIYHIGLSYLLIALTSGNGSGPSTKG